MAAVDRTDKRKLHVYQKEFKTINRIMTALSSTKNLDDIYSIILSSLISPHGLNYDRCLLFSYDKKFDAFRGSLALGPSNREDAKTFTKEMETEEKTLDVLINNHSLEPKVMQNEIWDACLSSLKVSSLWIATVQKFGIKNPIAKTIRRLSFSSTGNARGERFFTKLCLDDKPCVIDQEKQPGLIPPALAKILDTRFIALPLCTDSLPHSVLLIDRKYSGKSIGEDDLRPLQWFKIQASLAVENALLYRDLQFAYNDLKQMDILKSNFLSTISHELRTPLTTIHGFVELLYDEKVGGLEKKQRDLLLRVNKNTKHLIHMVNDIIDVAEIQAHGLADFELKAVNPLSVLHSAVDQVQDRKDGKRVRIVPKIDNDIPSIMADKHSLERIFYHLLDNAVKFSDNDATVTIRFQKQNAELLISICDQGIGIKPEHLQRIFDDFFQADGRLNRSFEGLGLGLTITSLLLKATGGKILAESTPGKGSSFTVVYPIANQ